MAQRAKVRVIQGKIVLEMEYNKRAVDALKFAIDSDKRTYHPHNNQWVISIEEKETVEKILEQFYPLVNVGDIRLWEASEEEDTDGNS